MRLYGLIVSLATWSWLVPWEALRIATRRSSWRMLRERLGRNPSLPTGAPTLLVHAVSAGEMRSAEPLLTRWLESDSRREVVLTTGTADGREIAEGLRTRHPAIRAVLFLPWDRPQAMRRWLARVRPCAIAVVEAEIWPGLFRAARAARIPLALVSARLTRAEVRRYLLLRRFFRSVLGCCDWIGARDEEAAALLRDIGAPEDRLHVAGDLKSDPATARPLPPRLEAALASAAGPLLVAGSTHAPEERLLIRMLSTLHEKEPRLRLLLAPREPRRAQRVLRAARRGGLRAALAGAAKPGESWSVLIVDSLGLLPSLYRFADVAFVGGSLTRHGGHNPLEAAASGAPIVIGPNTDRVRALAQALEDAGALRRADGPEQLEALVAGLLENAPERAAMSRAALAHLSVRRGVAVGYAQVLARLAGLSASLHGAAQETA